MFAQPTTSFHSMMAAFPPPPAEAIQWSQLGFDIMEVNGHIESTYATATGQWGPLQFVTEPYQRIHGMAPALNYGQQCGEGLKAHRMPDNSSIAIFRPDKNARRMQHSAAVASLPLVPIDMFVQGCRSAVAKNAAFVPPHETGAALYLRPQLFASSAQLSLTATEEYKFCVYAVPVSTIHGMKPVRALILDEFDRSAPRGVGHAKLGGNYAPVLRWSAKAKRAGYGITLHLDSVRHEQIEEFSTSGFVGIREDNGSVTIVVPDSECIIESITSDSILQIGRDLGWKTEKRRILYAELPAFTEVMAAGTASSLVPIQSVNRQCLIPSLPASPRVSVHDSSQTVTYMPDSQAGAGPIGTRLLRELRALQLGTVEDRFNWRCEVVAADMNMGQT